MKKAILIVVVILWHTLSADAQTWNGEVKIKSIPYQISWVNEPLSWEVGNDVFVLSGGERFKAVYRPSAKSIGRYCTYGTV